MSYAERLYTLWNSDKARSLGETLAEGLHIINQARAAGEEVQLDIELDIVNTANYAMDYGAEPEQLGHLLEIWKKSSSKLSVDQQGLSNKIFRLIAIIIQVSLGNLMIDTEQNMTTVRDSINDVFKTNVETTEDVIKFLFEHNQEALIHDASGSWKLDCLLAQITLFSMLEELGIESTFRSSFEELKELLKSTISDSEDKKVPNSDKFRFMHLMIFNEHPDERRWLTNYQLLKE